MTITSTWDIASLERETSDGYVYTAHWTCSAHDDNGDYSASCYGSVGFERPQDLIPYADLEKDQVIEWVKEALGSDKVLEIGQALLSQIDEQRNPTHESGVPWSN